MAALTLKTLFERSLTLHASRVGVSFGDTHATYAALDAASSSAAANLYECGVRVGDRVALLMRNRIEYVVLDIAIARLGAVKVPMNEMLSSDHVAFMLEHSGAAVLVIDAELMGLLSPAAEGSTGLHVLGVGEGFPNDRRVEPLDAIDPTPQSRDAVGNVVVQPTDGAAIFYTGGTTGRPKGVFHTQQSLAVNQFAQIMEAEIGDDERLLLTTPLPHAAGLFLQTSIIRGAHAEVHSRFEAKDVLEAISERDVTWTFVVPTMLYRILDELRTPSSKTTFLRTVVYGAAPIAKERLAEALDVFGPVFIQLYGQTECPNWGTRLSKRDHLAVEERPALLESCGRPSAMAEVRIVGDDGSHLPVGEVGEVCLRSPYLLDRYYRDEEATAAKFVGSWIRTGDVGLVDSEGYLYLRDRLNDVIISGGMNVHSAQVEHGLQECPGVAQVAIVGVPDPEWGEAVHAVVVRSPGAPLDEAGVLAFARSALARYERPKSVEFVDDLPLTVYGKVDKKALRAPHWAGLDRGVH